MTSTPPRIGHPRLAVPTEAALARSGLLLEPQRPLPSFTEPTAVRVVHPSSDPLVEVNGTRLRVLSNYFEAGWKAALPGCWLRTEVLTRLQSASEALPEGVGLAVHDAWRPHELQLELFTAASADPDTPDWLFAPPSTDPLLPAPHVSGGAVDVTLTIDGTPVAIGTDFDDATPASAAAALEHVPGVDREARRLLYSVMRSAGFIVFSEEWWHFEYGTPRWAAIMKSESFYGQIQPPSG